MDIRLKVSREEKNLVLFLVKYRKELHKSQDEPESLKPFTDFIIDVSFSLLQLLGRDSQMFMCFIKKKKKQDKRNTFPRTMWS